MNMTPITAMPTIAPTISRSHPLGCEDGCTVSWRGAHAIHCVATELSEGRGPVSTSARHGGSTTVAPSTSSIDLRRLRSCSSGLIYICGLLSVTQKKKSTRTLSYSSAHRAHSDDLDMHAPTWLTLTDTLKTTKSIFLASNQVCRQPLCKLRLTNRRY